ncbi:MAG TPA: M14 family zinc carboxypeptidase, partial [Thermoanaerobaculia bacterium]|nr:M14 family zinc carboxypeptidase [Thermoanaerobaculia bacterium]
MPLRPLVLALLLSLGAPLLDAAPPAPAEFLGWDIGERFTPHHRIVEYFEALAAARPDRISLVRFGETWERRPLIYAVITSAANRGKLEEIRQSVGSMSDPRRTSRTEAERIASETPAVVWLAFGVHGDESSSAEAAMMVASRLMRDDAEVRAILERTVV